MQRASPDYVSKHRQLVQSEQYSDPPVFGDDIFLCLVIKQRKEEASCHFCSRTVTRVREQLPGSRLIYTAASLLV